MTLNTIPWCPYESRQAFAHIPGTTHYQPLPLAFDGSPVYGVPIPTPGLIREPELMALRHCQGTVPGTNPLYLARPAGAW